jgi:DNA-directed RNA polymerase subunit M/transcription elongation factor TFIIS
MTVPSATPLFVECPDCGQRLAVRAEDRGRRGRCQQCGRVFLIGEASAATGATVSANPPQSAPIVPPAATTVTFSCSLCQTRITVAVANVGKTVKCPDCGRRNVIPAPPKLAPKRPPAAMAGDQFELWGVDDAPTPAQLVARTPTLHPVECRLCQTLMYATDRQVGTKLKCPDCGALTVAKARAAKKPAVTVLVADGEEYQLDDAPQAPVALAPALLSAREQQIREAAQIPAVVAAMAAQKKAVYVPPPERPKRPNNPLVKGVWPMIFTQEVIARWIALALLLGFVGQLLSESLLSPMQGMAEAIKIVFAAIGMALAGVWAAMAGPFFVGIVGESADGNDELYQPPSFLAFDWFVELFTFAMALGVAALAATGAWRLFGIIPAATSIPTVVRTTAAGAVFVLLFPPMLLSALLEGTPLGVISPKLLSTLGKCAGPWLLFYLQTFLLAAIVGGAAWALAPTTSRQPPSSFVWGMPPVVIAALIIDMRLLGRLAWWISDAMPADEDPEP